MRAQQLERLIHESVTVRRAGERIEIPAEELVVGDVVLLSAGDRVPADIRLTKVTDLFVSQAAITGESAILEKSCKNALSYGSMETLTQLDNLAMDGDDGHQRQGRRYSCWRSERTRSTAALQNRIPMTKQSFQKGANSIAWVMLRFIAVLIPIVFVAARYHGREMAGILRVCAVGGGRSDAGDAADGHHRLPCKG